MLALYMRLRNWLAAKEEGQDLVEYALIIVLVAIAIIAGLTVLGNQVNDVFGEITGNLNVGG